MIISDVFGENEEKFHAPLLGTSGRELARLLIEAEFPVSPLPDLKPTPAMLHKWWAEQNIFITTVFPFRPPSGKIANLCQSKKDVGGGSYHYPPIELGKYLPIEYTSELFRLAEEIKIVQPNLILVLGNTSCWATLGRTSITAIRGTTTDCLIVPGIKTLPTFHPSGVMRQWENRPILLADLIKARREMGYSEIRRPARKILVSPALAQIRAFVEEVKEKNPPLLSIDIETRNKTITMCSFAYSPDFALVIPFYNEAKRNFSHWDTLAEEIIAFRAMKTLLELPIPKLFQNGMYDLSYFYRAGIRPAMCDHDTMLLHHAILPEMQKGLGFLGSIYTNESSWKLLRKVKGSDVSNKAGE